MSSSRFTSIIYFLCFTLLLPISLGTNPLFHTCSNSGNFTAYGTYEANLNKLMGYLYLKAPQTGFGSGSVGSSQDQSYGLALCRGDVNKTDCQSCVAEAGSEIRKQCPKHKEATIWYDKCRLKYSNLDFFGKIDNQNKFYLWNLQNVSDPILFNKYTKELLSKLAEKAYVRPNMYATGELEISESRKLYGLVQCTRDLSNIDCKKCIDEGISELPSCCNGKEGGRVVSGSCTVHYEIYPIVDA